MRHTRPARQGRTHLLVAPLLAALLFLPLPGAARAGQNIPAPETLPVPGMVTMVDLGAGKCIPCKLMAPILAQAERDYRGRAAVAFIDVWEQPAQAERFGIKLIPTQIFFTADGKEALRHEGFLDRKGIDAVMARLGVQ